jgi:hypothetical protein
MKKAKIYITGKIAGDPNYKEKFERAQRELEAEGYIVLNPALLPTELSNGDFAKIAFAMMDVADAIGFIDDSLESPGAMLELEFCRYMQKNAFMITRKEV